MLSVLANLGVSPENLIAFVSDSAAVLRNNGLRNVYKDAIWVACTSHAVNNVAKEMDHFLSCVLC